MAEKNPLSVLTRFYSSNRRWLGLLARWLFFFLSCLFVYLRLQDSEFVLSYALIREHILTSWPWIALTVLLAPLNWLLESEKFRLLVRPVFQLSVFRAFRAYLTGTAISLFTPNRSGEFAGKILYLPAEHRASGALLAVVGSMAQLLVTIQAGLAALFIVYDYNHPWLYFLGFLLAVLVTVSWFWLPRLSSKLHRLPLPPSWKDSLHRLKGISLQDRFAVWGMSLVRYAVFCSQQLLLFAAFGVHPQIGVFIPLIAVFYFFMTQIPSIGLGEIMVRSGVALAVFEMADVDPGTVVVTTSGMWIINIALPALLGAFSVLILRRTSAAP